MAYSTAELRGMEAAAEHAATHDAAHGVEQAALRVEEIGDAQELREGDRAGGVSEADTASGPRAVACAKHEAAAPAAQTTLPRVSPATTHTATAATTPNAPISALPLRAVAPLAARVTRLVCDAGTARRLERELAIAAWQATLEASSDSDTFEQPGVLDLAHPAGPIRVLFDLAEYPALHIAALPDGLRPATPGDTARALRIAVAGVLLEPLLKRLEALGLAGMHVTQLARGIPPAFNEPDPRNCAAFSVNFSLDGTRHCARVLLTAPVIDALEALQAACTVRHTPGAFATHAASHVTQSWPAFADCMVPGRLILGSRRLPVDTLRALEAGDVLLRSLPASLRALLPGSGRDADEADEADEAGAAPAAAGHVAPFAQPANATVAWGSPGLMRVHAQVNLEGRRLSLTKEPIMTDELDPVRPDDLLAPDQHSSPIEIGELDLPVQFEVDTVALPLSQLYALRPGYVLELPTPVAEAQLKLVTHGQTIGYGELVTVGDHLGIRILRMAHGDGPVQ
ncbi:YscQ/HrcQ family type III secretion apparatus protein [bacterium M00.F.Ca.ET.228.01.1.1]|uniref:type III secretion system cytoplasmic ring protein SctQ n=1 Tax=Paraburkholderia phenoliruptrix TaxID=252970 RepID=UPI001091BB71|nr:type III secretion system cytoplasmic ring protein SctQ [Paraburkholderia phenoliruptrix]TGP46309.1 YscQ/HrcQ family type III secretion apparatus protein [bacterium M00.F.Ca.ET.228.01.1.1]TGS03777.1 YscQ/HrcQ family type III secretion apparatus protein [bacterium M00.F.Ca.ET.191.01.1.1]TGU07603.1 YscQ/HrcQ family type III secretion apparatus protein [bacterium M00.F.Ca.ET.155.01.1.1]MBW0446276.1 type III secretion system cytoplasmic ring protein SctQ [Paraburkholderia phenoliruptrix]MBW9096